MAIKKKQQQNKTERVVQSRRKFKAEPCDKKAIKINTIRKEAKNNAFINLKHRLNYTEITRESQTFGMDKGTR